MYTSKSRGDLLSLAAIAIVGLVPAACAAADPIDDVASPEPPRFTSPGALVSWIRMAFPGESEEKIDLLATSADPTIALAAAWERARRSLVGVVSDEVVSPVSFEIGRFLGSVEARVGCPIPPVWEATVRSSVAADWGVVGDSFPNGFKQLAIDRKKALSERPLHREGNRWFVDYGSQSVMLPAEVGSGPVDFATVQSTPQAAYVALYGWLPIRYRLFAVDGSAANPAWSTNVWADGGLFDYTGVHWHIVEIRASENEVAVFGSSTTAVYVEVFDKKSGENRIRFSSAYFVK